MKRNVIFQLLSMKNIIFTVLNVKNKNLKNQEIANKFESTRQSVWKALKPFEQYIKDPEAVEAFRHSKADILDAVMMEVLRLLVDEDKQKSATLGNVGYVLRILNELVRLERGQATSNIQSLLVKATKKLEELDPS